MMSLIINILNHKVPLWVCVILAGLLVFFATKPEKVVTKYAFSNRWEPPKPKLDLPPSKLILYKPYPVEKTRVDTIRVPQTIDRYYLIEPDRVSRIPRGLRLDVFDVSDTKYYSWEFVIPEPNMRAKLGVEAGSHVLQYNPFIGINAELSYKRFDAFGNARLMQDDYALLAGVRYNFVNFSK